jgi:predicted nucleic-acid-binding protein
MIGLDTNVLARYYVEDKADAQAVRQRAAARRLIESGRPLMVCKTGLLDLEWVMRGYYGFSSTEAVSVLRHLLALGHVTVEDRTTVEHALSHCEAGIELADAMHHASYRACASASLVRPSSSRAARKLGLAPAVVIPT